MLRIGFLLRFFLALIIFCQSIFWGFFPVFAYSPPPGISSNDEYYKAGFLNAALYAGVDPTGVLDSTVGLQKAIDDGHNYALPVYLPVGTYLVSDTLVGKQITPKSYSGCSEALWSAWTGTPYGIRKAPIIVGPSNGARPVIKLKNNAVGFNNASSPKAVLHFYNYDSDRPEQGWTGNAACGMGMMIRAIDVQIGSGNGGAVGIQMPSAQYSALEDIKIDATGAYAGIRGLPGRTGSMVNIEVNGGQYGVITENASPGLNFANLVLRGQTVAGIRSTTFGSAVFSGFSIEPSSGSAVSVENGATGNTTLYDGKIIMPSGNSPAVNNPNSRDLYLGEVYIKTSTSEVMVQSGQNKVVASSSQWQKIKEYSFTDPSSITNDSNPDGLDHYALVDGIMNKNTRQTIQVSSSEPPGDIASRHGWSQGRVPWFRESGVRNVKNFGATGNGTTNDRVAIQSAIDDARNNGGKVFLPRGDYLITGPIVLRGDTKIFGVPGQFSRIIPIWNPGGTVTYALQTEAVSTATTYLGDIRIFLEDNNYERSFLAALDWRAGKDSLVRQSSFEMEAYQPNPGDAPARSFVRIRDGGGGRWYGFVTQAQSWSDNQNYYNILISNTNTPTTFYGTNVEHAYSDYHIKVDQSSNIRFFGVKQEWSQLATFVNSENILLAGTTGHFYGVNRFIRFENCKNVLAPNLSGWVHKGVSGPWLSEIITGYSEKVIDGSDNCSLYKRGSFNPDVFWNSGTNQPPDSPVNLTVR